MLLFMLFLIAYTIMKIIHYKRGIVNDLCFVKFKFNNYLQFVHIFITAKAKKKQPVRTASCVIRGLCFRTSRRVRS